MGFPRMTLRPIRTPVSKVRRYDVTELPALEKKKNDEGDVVAVILRYIKVHYTIMEKYKFVG